MAWRGGGRWARDGLAVACLLFVVSGCSCGEEVAAPEPDPEPEVVPPQTVAEECIDSDGDGFGAGPGCTNGADCDDNSAAVGGTGTKSCYSGEAGTEGVGACAAGQQTCSAGVWSACTGEVLPRDELCDAVDNDCDGLTDEVLVLNCFDGPAGTEGVGVCTGGTKTCTAGTWGACEGQTLPSNEVCDDVDNDCNGEIDEALTRGCYNGPKGTRREGVCGAGTQTCSAGTWGACEGEVLPSAELCDNLDNDCDGETDEALIQTCYSGPEGTAGVGACVAGAQTCTAGAWSACAGEAVPGVEVCDGVDNDCNGSADEGLVRACYSGAEGTSGVGVCVGGTETCTNGAWSACAGEVIPAAETCDAADNNCNGSTDEKIDRVSQSGADQPIVTTTLPADIIVLMDTSCSMNEEIDALERNLGVNLANVVGASGLDYRIILIARFGGETHAVCIEEPLSKLRSCSTVKNGDCPTNGDRFFHYNVPIENHDSLYRVLDTFNNPDSCGQAPAGWSSYLRPEAVKHFIEITDDDPATYDAATFDAALLTLSPTQFGTPSARKYIWHTIGGLKENTPADAPWLPADPLVSNLCTGNGGNVKGSGLEFQKLSKLTDGYRFPLCQYQSFDTMFQAISSSVVSHSEMSCAFEVASTAIPADSSMQNAVLELIPTNGGAVQALSQVTGLEACSGMSFYSAGAKIFLCPDACQAWRDDPTAQVDVLFTCTNQVTP